jgi:serine/threonine protein phosphatase PrpC
VYALAVTLNEVATGTIPFSDCSKDNPACHTVLDAGYGHQELTSAVVAEKLRPCLPAPCPPAWARAMQACWEGQPEARPDCVQLLDMLEAMAQEESVLRLLGPLPFAEALRRGADRPNSSPGEGEMQANVHSTDDAVVAVPSWQQRAERPEAYRPRVSAGAYADAGLRGRDKMEDRQVIACPLARTSGASLLAVCDGHRGARAADFVVAQLPHRVRACWSADAQKGVTTPEGVLSDVLARCEADLAVRERQRWDERVQRMGAAAAGQRDWPGTTVAALLQAGDTLAWAGVGDCRAVLCRAGAAQQLTRNHVVADAQERARIEAAGGMVRSAPDGSLRVGAAQLQVSRSIGDFDAKGNGETGGLSAEAECRSCTLSDQDEFVILASDGLWDVVSNADAVALVHDTVKNPSMAAKRLAVEALARGGTDNVTVIVCFLRESEALESVYAAGKQKYALAATRYGSRAAVLAQLASSTADDELQECL